MNKKLYKLLKIIVYFLIVVTAFSNVCTAKLSDSFKGDLDGTDVTSMTDILSAVLLVIRSVGMFIAVGILMVLAIKYMLSSAGDRADIKKHAINYVIGALILFATSGIAGILRKVIEAAFPKT